MRKISPKGIEIDCESSKLPLEIPHYENHRLDTASAVKVVGNQGGISAAC